MKEVLEIVTALCRIDGEPVEITTTVTCWEEEPYDSLGIMDQT
jgi:hypothetical protein